MSFGEFSSEKIKKENHLLLDYISIVFVRGDYALGELFSFGYRACAVLSPVAPKMFPAGGGGECVSRWG